MKRAAEVSSEFVNLWLKSPLFFEQLDRGNGATVDTLTIQKLQSVDLSLPPLSEQHRIVGILDEAFEGIATAKANAERNLQNARAIFEGHLQSVFNKDGNGWLHATIGGTCTLKSGTTVSPTLERPVGDIPYLKVADMTFEGNEEFITTSSRFLRKDDLNENTIIPKGSTIFPKRGGAILTNKKRITAIPYVRT
jgi:type I restriction enzyme S subunit